MEFGGRDWRVYRLTSEQRCATWQQNALREPEFVSLMQFLYAWMKNSMPNLSIENMRNNAVIPDKDAHYDGGIHIINL